MTGDLAVAVVVGAVIGWLALSDARTMRIPVRTIQMPRIASIAGLTPSAMLLAHRLHLLERRLEPWL